MPEPVRLALKSFLSQFVDDADVAFVADWIEDRERAARTAQREQIFREQKDAFLDLLQPLCSASLKGMNSFAEALDLITVALTDNCANVDPVDVPCDLCNVAIDEACWNIGHDMERLLGFHSVRWRSAIRTKAELETEDAASLC